MVGLGVVLGGTVVPIVQVFTSNPLFAVSTGSLMALLSIPRHSLLLATAALITLFIGGIWEAAVSDWVKFPLVCVVCLAICTTIVFTTLPIITQE